MEAYLVNAELVEGCLQDLIIVDELIVMFGIEVHLQQDLVNNMQVG